MEITAIQVLREIWKNWDIQIFVMLSLSLQLLLISFASFRKRVSMQILHLLIWLAYLLADWAAAFAIGLIHNKGSIEGNAAKGKLFSFWAPFLIVHLGGPDTITALNVEDNELWLRRLLQFMAQAVATCNILYQYPPPDPLLWLPAVLIFVCGLIKYGERICALKQASLDKFRRSILRDPDPGPNYAMFMEQYATQVEDGLRTRIETIEEPDLEQDFRNFEVRQKCRLQGVQVVKDAYRFYQRFKGLVVDFEYSFRERHKSLQYFLSLEEDDAFRVVETELNFLYEGFYTKAVILHHRTAFLVRCCCLVFDLVSVGAFLFWDKFGVRSKKLHIEPSDVKISYTLLLGAVALDVISILVLIFSNWTVAFLVKDYKKNKNRSCFNKISDKVLTFGSRWLSPFPEAPQASQFIFQPWSNSISRFSLLEYYLNIWGPNFYKFIDYWGIKLFFDNFCYVDSYMLNQNMKKLIFEELKKKSEQVHNPEKAKELCRARGDWTLKNYDTGSVPSISLEELEKWIVGFDYDESLVLWHIATELCYNLDRHQYSADRVISKVFSDYMVYLLVVKPMMISNVAGISELRLRDTEADALRYIQNILPDMNERSYMLPKLDLLCKSMMSVPIRDDIKPRDVKGTRSKSVFFEACRLAHKLMKLPQKVRWEVMSRVWVELLCYAASHCRPTSHVQQVSKGGELISVVWFLMTHLGLGENFYLEDGPTRPKIIVEE